MSQSNKLESSSMSGAEANRPSDHVMAEILQSGELYAKGRNCGDNSPRQSEKDLNKQGADALSRFFEDHFALTGNLYMENRGRDRKGDGSHKDRNTGWVPPFAKADRSEGREREGRRPRGSGSDEVNLPEKPPKNPKFSQVDAAEDRVEKDANQVGNAQLRERYWSDEAKRDDAELKKDSERKERNAEQVKQAEKLLDKCYDPTELKHAFEDQMLQHQADKNSAEADALSAEQRRQAGITEEEIGKSRYNDGVKALKDSETLRKAEEKHRKDAQEALKDGDLERAQALLDKAVKEHHEAEKKEQNGHKWKLEGESLQKRGEHEQEEARQAKEEAQKRKERAEKMLELDKKIITGDGVSKDYERLQKQIIQLEKDDVTQDDKEISGDKADLKEDADKLAAWKKAEEFWTDMRATDKKYLDEIKRNYDRNIAS